MKHEQRIFATDCCEICHRYTLSSALASSDPGHIAMIVVNGLSSSQQIHLPTENKDADPVNVAGDCIYISIRVEVSVF